MRNRLLKSPFAGLEQIAEMNASDVLHGEKKLVVDPSGVERLNDVGVRKPHRKPCLVDEEGSKLVVLRQVSAHDFQGNQLLGTPQGRHLGTVHLAHAALGNAIQDSIARDGPTAIHVCTG